ncbi:MAG: CoA-binding protein [Verrucomicrobiota bacterium]
MEERIDEILRVAKTVAVVGISDKPDRPSHAVARYLQERGYRIVPVNPMIREVLGEKAYGSLSDIPFRVDVVDVFRKPGDVPPVAEEAVRIGARYFWMQEGVGNDRACAILDAAGVPWVMDRCMKKELAKRGR